MSWLRGLWSRLRRWRLLWTRTPRRVLGRSSLGDRGERLAERFLAKLGYTIVARNEHDRLGELDLVAVDGRTLVFVEVKTQSNVDFKRPQDAVDHVKRRRVIAASRRYLRRHGLAGHAVRYDIVAVVWPNDGPPTIEHLRDAFRDRSREPFQVD